MLSPANEKFLKRDDSIIKVTIPSLIIFKVKLIIEDYIKNAINFR